MNKNWKSLTTEDVDFWLCKICDCIYTEPATFFDDGVAKFGTVKSKTKDVCIYCFNTKGE